MTPQQLKNSILQLAIQGKLVEQRKEEGTGEDLYIVIQNEKKKLIEEGKIKKTKVLPEISEDEFPFDIPDSWKWVRLGEISQSVQYGYNAPAQIKGRIKMVRISDIQDESVCWENVPYCDIKEEEIEQYLLKNNDILFARTGGTVGKSFLVKNIHENAIYAGYLIRMRYGKNIVTRFLKYFMGSALYWEQLRNGTIATAQPNCNGQTLSKMILPLPPLEEQKRIVKKIEEILPLVERYEKAWTGLEELNKKFPLDMKKSILEHAIQGKLVEQRKGEGTGEELFKQIQAEKKMLIKKGKLKKTKDISEIIEDEIPFEIPDTWKWVRLGNIVIKDIKRGKSPKYDIESNVLVFAQKCNTKEGYIDLTLAKYLDAKILAKYPEEEFMKDYDIIVNSTGNGTLGRVGLYRSSYNKKSLAIVPDSHVTIIRNTINNDFKYIFYVLKYYQSYLEKQGSGSTNQTELRPKTIIDLLIPLPPFSEQKRIVERIEELLPLCEKLKFADKGK